MDLIAVIIIGVIVDPRDHVGITDFSPFACVHVHMRLRACDVPHARMQSFVIMHCTGLRGQHNRIVMFYMDRQ